jgi:hypothetical protein
MKVFTGLLYRIFNRPRGVRREVETEKAMCGKNAMYGKNAVIFPNDPSPPSPTSDFYLNVNIRENV